MGKPAGRQSVRRHSIRTTAAFWCRIRRWSGMGSCVPPTVLTLTGRAKFRPSLQIYDVDLVPLLLSTLRDLFDNYRIEEFLISATLRNRDTFQAFLDACGWLTLYSLKDMWLLIIAQKPITFRLIACPSNRRPLRNRQGFSTRLTYLSGRTELLDDRPQLPWLSYRRYLNPSTFCNLARQGYNNVQTTSHFGNAVRAQATGYLLCLMGRKVWTKMRRDRREF